MSRRLHELTPPLGRLATESRDFKYEMRRRKPT
jgi:hypothetical protein